MYSEDSQKIFDRMIKNADTSSSEGTLIFDALKPVAIELSKLGINLNEVLNKVFAQTAYDFGYSKDLEMRANEHGVFRKIGKQATGIITVEGIKNTEISKNTLVQTQLNLQYKTTKDATIPETGVVDIPIISVSEGNKYNVLANVINQLPVKLIGVSRVYNKKDITDGRDTEDDKSLYNRLKLKVSKPATSGNIYNYEYWALEVSGVGLAIIKPLWNGNGTVKVILVGSDGRKPNTEIIKNAKEHIEKNRPIGASVTVVAVNELSIQITVSVILEKDSVLEDVKTKFINNINSYLQEIALKDNIIRYNKIASCILNVPSVVDYKNLKVNNGTSDINLTNDSIAVLGSVVVDSVR